LERLATREPVDISREEILEALDDARAEREAQLLAAIGAPEAEDDDAGRD
jgi:hypothetical protein